MIESLTVKYDSVSIELTEDYTNRRFRVTCLGFIGIEVIGFWDDQIIDRAELSPRHEFINTTTEQMFKHVRFPRDTGCIERNRGKFELLEIILIAEARIRIVFNELQVEQVSE